MTPFVGMGMKNAMMPTAIARIPNMPHTMPTDLDTKFSPFPLLSMRLNTS